MPKPLNKKLYRSVVEQVKQRVSRWPSAYASGMVVKEYKRKGGTYQNDGREKSLSRWFKEKWIDVKSKKPCGSVKTTKYYPVCRPSVHVSSKTPKMKYSKEIIARKQKAKQNRIRWF